MDKIFVLDKITLFWTNLILSRTKIFCLGRWTGHLPNIDLISRMNCLRFVVASFLFTKMIIMVKSQACQTCDQIVTGRNFNYRAALNIIQNEDYLDEVDFNDIRTKRYYRVLHIFSAAYPKM